MGTLRGCSRSLGTWTLSSGSSQTRCERELLFSLLVFCTFSLRPANKNKPVDVGDGGVGEWAQVFVAHL